MGPCPVIFYQMLRVGGIKTGGFTCCRKLEKYLLEPRCIKEADIADCADSLRRPKS